MLIRTGAGRRAAALTLLLGCAACAHFGPGDTVPEAARVPPGLGLSEHDRFADTTGAPLPDEADLHWWRRFDDPALADWVERALRRNLDIAVASERVRQADALLQQARARRGPTVGLAAETELRLYSDTGQRRVQPGAALALGFDTDLFGGLQQAERAAAAGVQRDQALVQATRLAVAGLTARAYLEWRVALIDHELLAEALALQRESLRVVSVRVDAGLAPVLDRDRAQTEVATTEAESALASARIGQALAALQLLAGERAGLQVAGRPVAAASTSADTAQDALATFPALHGLQPVARPIDLLRQRPDLRASEQTLVAAAADIGVAEAAALPQLRLPGVVVIGAATGGAGNVVQLVSAALAAVLSVNLFDGGERQAEVTAAQSRAREAALIYRQNLLQALREVETALVTQRGAVQRIAARQRASVAARAAEEQAQTLYRVGLTGFLDVVIAQRLALANQRELLRAQGDAAAAAVVAFEAMGLIDDADSVPAR